MLCMTALNAALPVAVRQMFSFIAVAASEIVTIISSSSSLIFPSGALSEESSEKFCGLLN